MILSAISTIKNNYTSLTFKPTAGAGLGRFIDECLEIVKMTGQPGYATFNETEFLVVSDDTPDSVFQRWADNRELDQRRRGII